MTNRQPIPTDALLVALDIAKVRNEVLIEASNHKRRRRLSVLNTRAEHDRLIETLRAYGKPVICAFEATGNYHRPIAWRLIEEMAVRGAALLTPVLLSVSLKPYPVRPTPFPDGCALSLTCGIRSSRTIGRCARRSIDW